MLEAWISAMVCLNSLPSTPSSTVRFFLPLQADDLTFLERLGEVGEIAPATCGGANLVCCYVTVKSFFQLSLVATFEHEFQFRTC